jgi:hypothetical protein
VKPTGLSALVARLRRRTGCDGNDLRRDMDRRQRAAGLLLLMLFVVVGFPVCGYTARTVYISGVRAERYEAATQHKVDVTVLKVDDLRSDYRVTVTWREAGGRSRVDSYHTRYPATAGEHLELWAGPAGVSEVAPRRHALTVAEAVGAGLGAATAAGLPLLAAYLLVRYRCDRQRDRFWDAAWEHLDAGRSR